ncbi:replicative DNA helicase loader DnaB [Alkalibacterium putridalgicola]|uniref:Replication initiation and membrane attachment n=1 Tax=Alkalibacterium putridalgicola TaxID=426703 RepID=A0A1H7SXC6_9LACT|nr:DnaD domain protein [Alkalibacterium putridalgicola]GEK89235.1 replication initiation and membrane attachment [Alkalibacterium putridalgicola]SEL77261.1 replicative DNA helicase loader DnaB [Alkalibacterium putridalgicola]
MSYPWKNLRPKDSLILSKTDILSDLNVSTVLSLYQPLMGVHAASLYLLIKEYLDTSEVRELTLSDVITQLDIGLREYYESRIKLEAYGLLKVYKHKENEETYLLNIEAPLSPKQFFQDTMLRMLLTEKVGERLVSELKKKYIKTAHSTDRYQEITKSFHEVVHFNMENYTETFNSIDMPSQTTKRSLVDDVLKDSDFDWDFFMSGLNKHFIRSRSLTPDIKKLIETFHSIYAINELDMQKFVMESADITSGEVSEKNLTRIIHNHFLGKSKQLKSSSKGSPDEGRRAQELKAKGFKKEEIEIVLHAEKTQPYAYLKSIKQQKGGYVTSNETWLLKELVEQAPLSTAVINILMNYILVVKNAPMLEKNLASKIANDWAQNKVSSPEEAMLKVKELYDSARDKSSQKQSRSKSSYKAGYKSSASSRKETLPSWAKEDQQKDERVSKEEEEAFREELRKIREMKSGDI